MTARLILFALIVAALAAASTYLYFAGGGGPGIDPAVATNAMDVMSKDGPHPVVEIAEPEFNFGTMQTYTTQSHKFVVKNVGTAPLRMRLVDTTCKCTMSKVDQSEIPPGGSTEIELEWNAESDAGPFTQSATIESNAPDMPRITLTVTGTLVSPAEVMPDQIVLTDLKRSEGTLVAAHLYANVQGFKVVSAEVKQEGASTPAEFFEVKLVELPAEKRVRPEAVAAYEIQLRVKPGLPVGPFRQKIVVTTEPDLKTPTVIPITGNVRGDLSMLGPGWDSAQDIFKLGDVDGTTGKTFEFSLLVRGPHRDEAKPRVVRIDPDLFQVTIGEPVPVGDGAVLKYPVTLVIPPGTPSVNRYGSSTSKLAELFIDGGHPELGELRMRFRIGVLGAEK
jgi:hypothetical protein